jgi:hypothetical protein
MKQETQIKLSKSNKVNLIIHHIAVKQKNLDLIMVIKDKIMESLGISKRYLYFILENQSQPTNSELIAIHQVLQTFQKDIGIEDLTESQK